MSEHWWTGPARMNLSILILLVLVCAAPPAGAQSPAGGYYVGRIGDDSATVEIVISESGEDTTFLGVILGGGSISFGGSYRDGKYGVGFLARSNTMMAKEIWGPLTSLRISGDRNRISGTMPDSMGSAALPFTGDRVADLYVVRRPLPNDGHIALIYPLFVAGAPPLLRSVNDPIRSHVGASTAWLDAGSARRGMGGSPIGEEELHFSLTLQIVTWSPDLITISADSGTQYNGGDFPSRYEVFNFVREADTMRRVFLRDLFLPGSGYLLRLRTMAFVRADSLARARSRFRSGRFEGDDYPDPRTSKGLDTLDERADYLAAFRIDPSGKLFIFTPQLVDVPIDLEEIRDMIDPNGPLARFLTGNSPPDR